MSMADDLMGRWAALAFLEKILDDHLPLDQAFERTCRQYGDKLNARDRGFIRHLVTNSLRRLGQLDAMINHCTSKKLTSKQKKVRNILRLGIVQLLYMEVPAHAAVNCAVKMTDKCKTRTERHMKGMVNAILRRIEREREKFSDNFSPELNLPKWLKENWQQQYGRAEVAKICESLLMEPPLDISLKPELDAQSWAQKLDGIILPTGSIRCEAGGSIQERPGYEEGQWWVQDMAAALPAKFLGAGAGDRILDLCAAPGGKAAQSAAKGGLVTAVDLSERRLRRLEENKTRLNLDIDVVTSDILDYKPEESFRYILLDAPCSSTGTLRRHPELTRLRGPRDVADLALLQAKLLDAASDLLPIGGCLIYCVCSMQYEEGLGQIEALLKRNRKIRRKPIEETEVFGLIQCLTDKGDVQTLPHHYAGGMDGFYIARLTKTAE